VGSLAEKTFDRLPRAVRDEFGALFRTLVDVDEVGGPVRRRARLSAVQGKPHRRSLVDALVRARLLVVERGDDGESFVELAHEAVFRHWPRLTAWIDEEHEHLLTVSRMRRAALEWEEAGRDPAYHWPEERMAAARAAVERLDAELTDSARAFLRPETDRLLDELAKAGVSHVRRRDISIRLTGLGDVRPGVGVRPDGLPDVAWIRIPAGRGRGSAFWISKYPVTVVQLDAYRRGAFRSDIATRTGLEDLPDTWPACCNWDEATNFAHWLMWRATAEAGGNLLPDAPAGYVVRLPTEQEWTAAAGGYETAYPWGGDWHEECAHANPSGLLEPLAVGMYPRGDSPHGVSDLAGTVWEWCDGESTAGGLRILKGGSRLEDPRQCRVDVRREMRGDVSREDRGFRVCFGPEIKINGKGF